MGFLQNRCKKILHGAGQGEHKTQGLVRFCLHIEAATQRDHLLPGLVETYAPTTAVLTPEGFEQPFRMRERFAMYIFYINQALGGIFQYIYAQVGGRASGFAFQS